MPRSNKKKSSPLSKKKSPTHPQTIIKGTLRVHPRGFGFVIPEDINACPEDVFIPKHLTDNAVDGDLVEISINPDSNWEKGPDGRILSIVKRGRSHLTGTITNIKGAPLAHVPILGENRPVIVTLHKEEKVAVGERFIFTVNEWGDQKEPTICSIYKKIGHIDDPSCDITAATLEFELNTNFPSPVVKEAKAFGQEVAPSELQSRLDLTKTCCFTIDPETAKDFDDALSISKDKNKHFFVGVHIADVAHYIPYDSKLDKEAFARCNSTYFPGTCVPMLPEELSNNLCSLKEGVVRLTVSVFMHFDTEGTLLESEIRRTFIKSEKRYTYGEVKEILEEKRKSPHLKELKQMTQLCLLLKKKRSERGSIDFSLPELVILVNKKGEPTGVRVEEYDITHQLVEEFMLKANEIVAKSLADRGKTPLYRVHEEPSSENMEEFGALARALGFELKGEPSIQDLQKLFEAAKKTPFSEQLSIAFIRNLKLATYSPENIGHFGLALDHYCHFTSPIRRYSDLITQRLLFNEEAPDMNLTLIALKCSEKERLSFRAEMSVKMVKKLRLLKSWYEKDPERPYRCIITKIKPFGLYFEVKELFLEGFLHISELEDDFFTYDAAHSLLCGKSTGKKHSIGQEIQVHVLSIDLIYLVAKWELLETPKEKRKKKRK